MAPITRAHTSAGGRSGKQSAPTTPRALISTSGGSSIRRKRKNSSPPASRQSAKKFKTSVQASNWDRGEWSRGDIEQAFAKVEPEAWRKRLYRRRDIGGEEQDVFHGEEYDEDWVINGMAGQNPVIGLGSRRDRILEAAGVPTAKLDAAWKKLSADIVELFERDPGWALMLRGKVNVCAQPATHSTLYWVSGVTEVMRRWPQYFGPARWGNAGDYAYKVTEIYVMETIKRWKEQKARTETRQTATSSTNTKESMNDIAARVLHPDLADITEVDTVLAVKCIGSRQGITSLTWYESWAWKDDVVPNRMGLLSRLRREFGVPEAEEFFFFFEVAEEKRLDAEEEIFVNDNNQWSGSVASTEEWGNVARHALCYGAKKAGKVRLTTTGPPKDLSAAAREISVVPRSTIPSSNSPQPRPSTKTASSARPASARGKNPTTPATRHESPRPKPSRPNTRSASNRRTGMLPEVFESPSQDAVQARVIRGSSSEQPRRKGYAQKSAGRRKLFRRLQRDTANEPDERENEDGEEQTGAEEDEEYEVEEDQDEEDEDEEDRDDE